MSKPRKRRWIRTLVIVVVCFAILEAGFRVYLFQFASQKRLADFGRRHDLPDHSLRYAPHPYLSYCLNPAYRSEDGRNRHNALGFRGDEFPREKPEGTYRIACLGGSSTYDTEIDDFRDAYPVQLEAVLRETHGRNDIHVINAGVPGYSSWESLINLQLRVLDVDPDLVVVYHATNDVHARLVRPGTFRRDNTGFRRAWTEERHWWDRSALLHFLGVRYGFSQGNGLGDWVAVPDRRSPKADWPSVLDAHSPRHFEANLETMVAIAKHHGVGILLTSWASCADFEDYASTETYQRGFREHNEVSREVAGRCGVPFYDFAADMPADREFWSDGRHNNQVGARRKAELFAAFIHDRYLKE